MNAIPAKVRSVVAPRENIEQRLSERRRCDLEALSCPLDAPESLTWGAHVHDISATGIGLRLCYPFKPGTHLAINLQTPRPRSLLARVIHVADQSDGTWFLGCELVKELDGPSLDELR